MEKTKRNPTLIIIGVIMIISGVITFIVSAVQLYNVQRRKTHWAEGFMQDYQARTNATNSIPCYIFMALAVLIIIAGIVMLCIKPRTPYVIVPNMPVGYNNTNKSVGLYCVKCRNPIGENDIFCKTCGYNLNAEKQVLSNKKICQNCGGMNNADGKFCIKCGRQL